MRFSFLLAICAIAIFSIGCEKPAENASNSSSAGGHDHGDHSHDDGTEHTHDGDHAHSEADGHDHGEEHNHAHDHDDDHPAHGPNGGHVFDLDADGYIGEWKKFPGSNVIKIYILNKKQEPRALNVDSFEVIPMTGDDQTPFVLEADEPDADGKSAVYSLDDQLLHLGIPLGVTIKITAGKKIYNGKIAAHEPLDH